MSDRIYESIKICCAIIALIIITDFLWPGSFFSDKIIKIEKERQEYYNAAQNYHYSYKVTTNTQDILIKEETMDLAAAGANISYGISPIFNEINWYKMDESKERSYHSLRIISGLILPLVALLLICTSIFFKHRFEILVFVLQILVIGDFIFLLN